MTQGTFHWNYFEIWPSVSEKKPHTPKACLYTDQNFRNNFWKGSTKGHSCEIILKSDQRFRRRRFFKEILHVPIVQNAPIHQNHVYTQIKISGTIFEKGHSRNIPVKLFQNQTNGNPEEKILKELLKKFMSLQWQPVFDGIKFLKRF